MDWLKRKFLSRKFLTLLVGVAAGAFGLVPWDQVLNLAMVWIGAEAVVDASHSLKKD